MVDGLPADFPQGGDDRPAAEHGLGPGVVYDVRDAAESEDLAVLKVQRGVDLIKTRKLMNIYYGKTY